MTKYETVKANESGAMSNAREYAARRDYNMAAFWYHASQGFRMRAETMTIREAMREAEGHLETMKI